MARDERHGLAADCGDDPRLHAEHVRRVPGADGAGSVTLLGVVHDHPASRYRVHALVEALSPDVLALEVGPMALPLYERYAAGPRECVDGDEPDGPAATERTLPVRGGEVSAAIAAAGDARVVGVDAVDGRFFRTLARRLVDERASGSTLRRVARSVTGVVRHSVRCRLAAIASTLTDRRAAVDDPVAHDCDLTDPPETQADDERRQLSASLTLLRCADPPEPVAIRDETRDACMAARLDALRAEGDVVAVVGRGHLEPLAERLA